jgi:colanic acid/amylovoran biosynthesis glycosyltransferase
MMRSVAYLVSRFPSVSETFVLNEILELEALGWKIHLYPMIRQVDGVTHPRAQDVTERANYRRITSIRCVRAHLYWAKRRPATYLRILALSLTLPGLQLRFYPRTIWATLWATMIASEIEESGIRHVHAHWATFPAHAAMVISRLTGCTFSFTAHAHDIYANAYGLKSKISEATFAVTISELNRGVLMRASAGSGQTKVIRCGVDLDKFSFGAHQDDPSIDLRVIAVGSLEEKKGHRYLLEACALLTAQAHPVDCRIIGEGAERARLERLIDDLKLEDHVTLLGWRDSSEVAAELAAADVFVMPSVVAANGMMEGIPVALMEAMATGLPVIASQISGIPELVADGVSGILVHQRDAQAIANAISALRHDSQLRLRLGTAAREMVADRYNLRKNVQQLADEFESTLLLDQMGS